MSFDIKKYSPLVHDNKIKKYIKTLEPGTLSYNDFWEEQDYYCKNGFTPKGMSKITGKHYFYLNIWKIEVMVDFVSKRKELGSPWYRQLDDTYFKMFQECKTDGTGMIIIKARDKGFSEMNAVTTGHEWTMYPDSNSGIAAGLDASAQTIFRKIKKGIYNLPKEYKHHVNLNNDRLLTSGIQISKEEVLGYDSKIHCRTMLNPNVFKGERLGVMVFEEAGEFKSLLEAYEASKACFMSGAVQYGVPIIGGTGGDIDKSSADFKTMWYEHKDFNLRRLFIPASECLMGTPDDETAVFFDKMTGKSDRDKAKAFLEEERRQKSSSGNKKAYNLHIQNYPLSVNEAFMKTKDSIFDLDVINYQLQELRENHELIGAVESGDLEWDDRGHEKMLSEITDRKQKIKYRILHKIPVKFTSNKSGVYKILAHPQPHLKGLDIGGVDSFDAKKTGTKGSEGSAIIYRNFHNVDSLGNCPIADFTNRTSNHYDFYEGTLKLAVYYGCEMLIEHTKINILDFYEDVHAWKYLKERPETIHSKNSVANNKYGVNMTKDIKARMIELMDYEIKEHGEKINFEDLLSELADFGDRNTDRAMAYGICLLHKKDNFNVNFVDVSQDDEDDIIGLVEYDFGPDGSIIVKQIT